MPEATRKALTPLGWPMGASDGGFGGYECIERRMNGADRVWSAASEMRADGCAGLLINDNLIIADTVSVVILRAAQNLRICIFRELKHALSGERVPTVRRETAKQNQFRWGVGLKSDEWPLCFYLKNRSRVCILWANVSAYYEATAVPRDDTLAVNAYRNGFSTQRMNKCVRRGAGGAHT